jgi:phage shock protein PspC (stress-responsive transcriptional regulator)
MDFVRAAVLLAAGALISILRKGAERDGVWAASIWEVMSESTSLQRPARRDGRAIAGVCAALAARFGVSRFLVRTLFVIFGKHMASIGGAPGIARSPCIGSSSATREA